MNIKQKAFLAEYLKDFNATAAAERAGYKQPHSQGPRLLENVEIASELAKIQNNKTNKAILEFEEACEILSDIARAKIPDYLNESGNLDIKLGNAVAIQEIKIVGETFTKEPIISFKLHPKIAAIDRLAKMRGWDKPVQMEHTGDIQIEVVYADAAPPKE